jgi:O-antigen/teichoic acid export membrane protein
MKFYGRAALVGMVWSWVTSVGTELMWLPTAMITARLLTPQDFGVTATASFFINMAARLTQFGFNAALLRMKEVDDDHASSIFVMNIVLGATAWVILALSSPAIASFFRSPATGQILPIAALSFLAVPFGTVPSALLMRDFRYKEITLILWINTLTSSLSTISLAWLGFGYWSLVYGQLIAAVVSSVAKLYYGRWRLRFRFTMQAARDTFSFGMGIYALRLVEYGALNLDSMAVGRTMGMTALGFYDKAFNLMSRVLDRLNQAGPVISFRVFALIQDEQERYRRGYRKVTLSATLLGYPALTVLALVGEPLFRVLFGEQWVVAARPFQILCVAGAFKMLNTYSASVVEAAGHVWAEVWRQVVYLALIVGGVVALRPWGTTGAALAVLTATMVMTGLLHHLLLKATPVTVTDVLAPQLPAVGCSLGVAFFVTATNYLLDLSQRSAFVQLLVMGGVGVGVFLAFLFFAPVTSVRELVDDVLEHLLPVVKNYLGMTGPQAATEARPADERR